MFTKLSGYSRVSYSRLVVKDYCPLLVDMHILAFILQRLAEIRDQMAHS